MRRKLFVWLLVFALLMALPGCGRKEQEPEGGIQLYFLKDSGESTGSFVPGAALGTQSFDAAVDALCGTWFHGELRPSGLSACGLIRYLHNGGAFVLAVDLPSGINTDTGEVAEGAAHADLTVTFDSYKPLHLAETSALLCGKIVCADIGIRDEWHPEF
mgnify:CR=1 FL=1